MAILSSETIHATCIAIDGQAVLLLGASGSGKSDLGLRLIDRGAVLVSDDYTLLLREDGILRARPPETITGRIEVRHVGIVTLPYAENMPVALAIQLDAPPERLPDRAAAIRFAGVAVPLASLSPMEASAPIKVELLLQIALQKQQGIQTA